MTVGLKSSSLGRVRHWARVRSVQIISLSILAAFAVGSIAAASPVEDATSFLALAAGGVSIATERDHDGKVRIGVHGAVYDGRRFIRALVANRTPANLIEWYPEFELEMNVGTLIGFNDEILRDVRLRVSKRLGAITGLALNAKQGNARISGDLQIARDGRRTIRLTSENAGSLLRLFGLYRQISGGRISVILNMPAGDAEPMTGNFSLRDFNPVTESILQRVEVLPPDIGFAGNTKRPVELRGEFQRFKNTLWVRNGAACSPVWAASFAGLLDNDDLQMRGVLSFRSLLASSNLVWPRCGDAPNPGGLRYTLQGSIEAPRIFVSQTDELSPAEMRHVFGPPSR